MKRISVYLFYFLGISCLFASSQAQAGPIEADASLSIPSAVSCSSNNCTINGGTVDGNNLFHSFTQFSVPTGGTAYFNNATTIQNILGRVTGSSVSNIDGLITANGTADLFLLNPNGIIFGSNARLSLSGSFVASTASAIKFADGSSFSATEPQTAPLLTVSVPVGLQFGSNPGSISVQGQGQGIRRTTALVDTTLGLRVQPNETLALVGGDIAIDGGTLKTAGGRIELGSVGEQSFVSLIPVTKGWTLGYDSVSIFRNIQLSNRSAVDASGLGGGDIQFQAKRVSLLNGSQVQSSTLGSQAGGTLAVNATESVELIGRASDNVTASGLSNGIFPNASGAGGKLIVSTKYLLLDDRAAIDSSTFAGSTGAAGNVTLNTETVSVRNGSQISAASNGLGLGGSITVNASNSVEVIGVGSNGGRSGLFTVSTSNAPAGNVTINTSQVVVKDGARVSTSTRRGGSGGTLTVNATDSVEVSGISPDGQNPSGLFALSGELSPTTRPSDARGAGGSLIINTGELTVRDRAQLSVSAGGSGEAGNLNITANALNVDNFGSISAETRVGTGGNINLDLDNLRMRHNSTITTSAIGTATGGNINISTDTLVALENSNITANAVRGRGGNIQITTQGIFLSPDSKITASSELGLNGAVQVQTLGFDVKNTLTSLVGNFVSTDQVVAGSCLAQRNGQQGSFTVTGTGGLPSTPYEATRSRYGDTAVQPIQGNTSSLSDKNRVAAVNTTTNSSSWKIGQPIIEAQKLISTTKGRTLLAAAITEEVNPASNLVCYANGSSEF